MELIKLNLEIPYEKARRRKARISGTACMLFTAAAEHASTASGSCYLSGGRLSLPTSSRESESIAMQYLAAGMQAFVLYYNCAPSVFPCALLELAKSVSIVRSHAAEWNIDPERF